ncbi:MAG: glycosyl transferase [Actinomycetota bacterium]|nr:glycosyl transferase [Actinomycetota bacterium]
MPARILFVTLAGHGHVTPTLPLVTELVRRGHRVEYATGPEHADDVVAAGADRVRLPGLPPFRPPAQVGPRIVGLWFRHFFAALRATHPLLHAHVADTAPDVIVYDETNWPARVVAQQFGIPAVRTVPNLASNPHWSLDERMTEGLAPDDPTMAALAEDCAAFSAEAGVPFDVAGTFDVPEEENLVFVPRAFQPAGDTFDGRYHFLGPLLGDRANREAYAPPDGARPLVYVSLGTIFTDRPGFYRTCIDAFADGAWQVAMTVGDVDVSRLGPVPGHVDVRARFPQLAVLRRAGVFVTHAGMNSTMEALAFGVPMVTLPQMPEQAANADRIVELGLGERLPAEPSAADLRAAADRVAASREVRANLDRAAVRDGGGVVRGADLIEHRARAGR